MDNVILIPRRPCTVCRIREATRLCDYVVDYVWTTLPDECGRHPRIAYMTCDAEICKQCAVRIGPGVDFCPKCAEVYRQLQKMRKKRR